jgi:hypothetical protein
MNVGLPGAEPPSQIQLRKLVIPIGLVNLNIAEQRRPACLSD